MIAAKPRLSPGLVPALVPGLVPVENALAAVRRQRGPEGTRGVLPGLLLPAGEPDGWLPAESFIAGGDRLDDLLDAAKQRWGASPHAAAALAWRSYTYWLALPVVLGWATARRVPLLDPDDVRWQVSVSHDRPLLTLGLRRARLAVLAGDPIATDPVAADHLAGSEPELLAMLRATLREQHLDPLLAALRTRVNLGERTLLGSLASAVAYAVVRGVEAPPADQVMAAGTLLTALGLTDLVDFEPGPNGEVAVRRRTCCLAFTLPEPKVCSGCCLRPA
ncbi:MAG TPA: (2Fe-2S)-binding protein [Natronosporangium sp.]